MDGSIKMWLKDAINAVKVIMNVLVPTAVLSYISRNAVSITIIMPLPVSHKSSFKADGQSEEQRNHYSFEVQFFILRRDIFKLCIRFHQKVNAYEERQKQRKSAKYNIIRKPCYKAAHNAHAENAGLHNPSTF